MTYLILLAVLAIVFLGFFILTVYESRHTVRFFAARRERLDALTERALFVWNHVDLGAFLREEVQRLAKRLGHDTVHVTLQLVRATERLLTRLIRQLRTKEYVHQTPRESGRPFIESLSSFREQLAASRPVREQQLREVL